MADLKPPFTLLTLTNERPLWLRGANDLHVASFRRPNGANLLGLPAASEAEAVHRVFEADEGRPLPTPYANHLVPLSDAVLALCNNVSWITWAEASLFTPSCLSLWLRDQDGLGGIHAREDVKKLFANFQDAVASVQEIGKLLDAHAAAPDAYTMREHPLTGYATFAAIMTMSLCEMMCEPLGIPGAISRGKAPRDFNVTFDPYDGSWAAQQADRWWSDKYVCTQRYIEWLNKLVAKAPTEEEFARKLDDMLTQNAEALIRQTGQARPAILDNPAASWREKYRALSAGARLH